MATTKNSVNLSLPKAQKVRGYTIDRMPIGRFLRATQILQEIPGDLMRQLFPGVEAEDILHQLSSLTKDGLQALFTRALGVLPEYVVRLFAELSGIEEEKLLTDPVIGLDGLCEMLNVWIEVNGIENFIEAAGALWVKVRKTTAKDGSKTLSPEV